MSRGTLIIIGGHEDRRGERGILRAITERLRGRPLVLATVASGAPAGYVEEYEAAFADLVPSALRHLHIHAREEAYDPDALALFDGAGGVFFTGGDQMRIARQIADTAVEDRVRAIYEAGGVIGGTSAGASAMSEEMLTRGVSGESPKQGEVRLMTGLGLLPGVVIDQHFAERGRIGRLLGAVAAAEASLGIGIDEDTAVVVDDGAFTVIGSGAVTVVDGARMAVPPGRRGDMLTVHDARVHLLTAGDRYDLRTRRPS